VTAILRLLKFFRAPAKAGAQGRRRRLSRLWAPAFAGALLGASPTAAQPTGRFVEIAAVPSTNIAAPHVVVWLPPGYDGSNRRYPVAYMHDGQNLFFPDRSNFNKVWAADRAALRLIAAKRVAPFIIVGIDQPGEARFRQYFPERVVERASPALRAILTRDAKGPFAGDAYLRFLAQELKPLIDRRYRTQPGPESTATIGSSMGGLISCYAFTRLPRVFGRAGCVSTHWPLSGPEETAPYRAEIVRLWGDEFRRGLGRPGTRRLWMDHGDQTLDAHYPPYQAEITRAVAATGWRHGRDFVARAYPGTAHEENAWAARMDDIFAFLWSGRS
jgi:predicted alpha/beta superfamily hydrolase